MSVAAEFAKLQLFLDKPETEHTWEQIDAALKKFHTQVRAGLSADAPEFVSAMRSKSCAAGMIRSLTTERTRLSGTTLEVFSSSTRLAAAFAPLLPVYLPAILRLLCRTNKLYISRTLATLHAILKNTRLPELIKYIVAEWKAEGGKSSSYRIGASEIVLAMLGGAGREGMAVDKEGLEKRFIDELEWIVRVGATDKEVKVRALVKSIWEAYQREWPDRVSDFAAPLSPVTRKYLSIAAFGASGPILALSLPTSRVVKKPKVPTELHPMPSSYVPSTTHPLLSSVSGAPPRKVLASGSLSKSLGPSHGPPASVYATSSSSTRLYAKEPVPSIPKPLAAPPRSANALSHSVPASSTPSGGFRPLVSSSRTPGVPASMTASSTTSAVASSSTSTRPPHPPLLRKPARAAAPALPSSLLPSTTSAALAKATGPFRPKLTASRVVRPIVPSTGVTLSQSSSSSSLSAPAAALGAATILRNQTMLHSARAHMASRKKEGETASASAVDKAVVVDVVAEGKEEDDAWDGDEGAAVELGDSQLAGDTAVNVPLPASPADSAGAKTEGEVLKTAEQVELPPSPFSDLAGISFAYPTPALPPPTTTASSAHHLATPARPAAHSLLFSPIPNSPLFSSTCTSASTVPASVTPSAATGFFADLASLEPESFHTRSLLRISPTTSPVVPLLGTVDELGLSTAGKEQGRMHVKLPRKWGALKVQAEEGETALEHKEEYVQSDQGPVIEEEPAPTPTASSAPTRSTPAPRSPDSSFAHLDLNALADASTLDLFPSNISETSLLFNQVESNFLLDSSFALGAATSDDDLHGGGFDESAATIIFESLDEHRPVSEGLGSMSDSFDLVGGNEGMGDVVFHSHLTTSTIVSQGEEEDDEGEKTLDQIMLPASLTSRLGATSSLHPPSGPTSNILPSNLIDPSDKKFSTAVPLPRRDVLADVQL